MANKEQKLRSDVVDFRTVKLRLADYDILNILLKLRNSVRELEQDNAPKIVLDNEIRLRDAFEMLYKSTYNGRNQEAMFRKWQEQGFKDW